MASKRAILHVVPYGENASQLPGHSIVFLGLPLGGSGAAGLAFVLILASAGFSFGITAGAWDHEGFFHWTWNLLWAVFPWFFLTPLWVFYFLALKRAPEKRQFHEMYAEQWQRVRPVAAVVDDVQISRTDDGGVHEIAVSLNEPGRQLAVARMAAMNKFEPYQAPEPGDVVYIWRFADDWIIVQAQRGKDNQARRDPAAGAVPGPVPAGSLAEQLELLAGLHRDGALSRDEFEQAKRKLLS